MLKTLHVLINRYEDMDRVCRNMLASEGLAPGIDHGEWKVEHGLESPCERIQSMCGA